ncbi:hypothetical protein BC940DRAFT_302096 [Gongronella butleri]|nr:hypothetical protein BC940DRAFT_302096 [Gongronella butleri]
MQHAPAPYMLNHPRRKRRDSDYTSDGPVFSETTYNGNIYHPDRNTILDVRINSKVDRGFFMADNDWTCYRRNYFQVSCAFSLQGVMVLYDGQDLPCVVRTPENAFDDIEQFYVGLSARLSDCDKQISLVQHTAKRDKGPQSTPAAKPIRPGGNLTFSSVGANQSIVTFERIQFKSATANNGKRRAAQQYYVLVMDLFAKTRSTGAMVHVASTQSQHLVVRGRSPGHYAENPGTPALIHAPPPPHPAFYDASPANMPPTPNSAGGPMRPRVASLAAPPPPPPHHHPGFNAPPPPMMPPPTSSYPAMYGNDYASYAPYGQQQQQQQQHHHHHHHAPPPPGAYYAGVPQGAIVSPSSPHSQHPASQQHPSHPPPHPNGYDYAASPSQPGTPGAYMPPPYQHQQQQQPHTRPDAIYDAPPSSSSYPQPYTSLPPPMHRSESAPSAYDHIKEEQQQQWARARMSSTPNQPPYYANQPTVPYYPQSYGPPSHHDHPAHWQQQQQGSPQQPHTPTTHQPASSHVNEYQSKDADNDHSKRD